MVINAKLGMAQYVRICSDLLPLICLITSTVVGPEEMLALRWNSQHGSIFVDGSHFKVTVRLGANYLTLEATYCYFCSMNWN